MSRKRVTGLDGVYNLDDDEYKEYRTLLELEDGTDEQEDRLADLLDKIDGKRPGSWRKG